jgi:PHP domain
MVSGPMTVGVVHVHSDFSHDGRDPVERIHDLAVARGVGFVAMSDHAEDFDEARFTELAARCRAVSDDRATVIAGLEFRFAGFRGLHLLALGLERWINPRTPGEFAAVAPGVCGLTVVAHPGLAGYRVPPDVVETIDAIEVWNAAYNTRYLPDPRAIDLLRKARETRPAIVGVAGLDQHDAANDRETRVITDGGTDPLRELRAGHFHNRGKTLGFGPRGEWPAAGLAALRVARRTLDVIERTQERWALARRSTG